MVQDGPDLAVFLSVKVAMGASTPNENTAIDLRLAERMREEWNRRVQHDYRYWMSDGVESDEAMWKVGQRDFSILTKYVPECDRTNKVALEIGCGVGRLLRVAAGQYQKVIGLDIADQALTEAKRLLADLPNVSFLHGNGADLQPIEDNSIDLVYAFASLSSMPVAVMANYLSDMSRVLRPGGYAALQVYLGKVQATVAEDTIAIRSYETTAFEQVVRGLGFTIVSAEELILPFSISSREDGLVATCVTLEKSREAHLAVSTIAQLLNPAGEGRADQAWPGSETEYLMALARAQQHMDAGDADGARIALEFATQFYAKTDNDIRQMLAALQKEARFTVEKQATGISKTEEFVSLSGFKGKLGELANTNYYLGNLNVIKDRFPAIAAALESTNDASDISTLLAEDSQPVIIFRGIPLDQKNKPAKAAEVVAERSITDTALESVDGLAVFGFAGGYLVEALTKRTDKPLHVVEPSLSVLKAALLLRDLRIVLSSIASLSLSVESADALSSCVSTKQNVAIIIHPQTKALYAEAADSLHRAVYSVRARTMLRPNIGVVGPLYGGSLPISYSVSRALYGLNQRIRPFDMSVFYDSYKAMPGFVANHARIDSLENQYVEMISSLILESIIERPVDILICLAQAPMTPRVLDEIRSRGVITVLWFVEDYRRFTTWTHLAKHYDYVFMIQEGKALQLCQAAGAGRAIYLPVGCDPNVHRPIQMSGEEQKRWGSDVSFVGAGYNNRKQMFATLGHYDFKIWGTEWPSVVPFDRLVQDGARRLSVDEYVKIFNASKVNLNLHSSAERDGVEPGGDFVNPRTFELAACGAFQLTDMRTHLPAMFDCSKEVATFTDRKEMVDKIDYFLAHPTERLQYATAARERALRDHTYQQRMQQMLDHIYTDHFERLKNRIDASPWKRTLAAAEPFPELRQRFEAIYETGEEPVLSSLVRNIKMGSGSLSDTERKLLFFDNITYQVISASQTRNCK